MAGYRVKLPKELKDSLVSEFEGSWDSENEEMESTRDATKDTEPPQKHDSVSSQSSTERKSSKSLGSRLKRMISPGKLVYRLCISRILHWLTI